MCAPRSVRSCRRCALPRKLSERGAANEQVHSFRFPAHHLARHHATHYARCDNRAVARACRGDVALRLLHAFHGGAERGDGGFLRVAVQCDNQTPPDRRRPFGNRDGAHSRAQSAARGAVLCAHGGRGVCHNHSQNALRRHRQEFCQPRNHGAHIPYVGVGGSDDAFRRADRPVGRRQSVRIFQGSAQHRPARGNHNRQPPRLSTP